jgi:hypothetical protein
VTLRKQKNKEMKRLKRALFSRDADDCLTGGRAWIYSLAGSKAAARHAIRSMPANSAPVCSIRAADGTSNRVGGNYNGVP